MGNNTCTNNQSYQQRFKNKYEFISLVNDHSFGEVKVYRKKQLNYDYVMVLHKYVQTSMLSNLVKQIEGIHSAFLKKDQPMALRIFNFDIDDNQISNCSLSLVKLYVEYFNYTLHDLIETHRQKGDGFTLEQLKYVFHSCVLTYEQFLSITQKNINLVSKSIYLTPEGAIKFCPIRSQQFFQHSNAICNIICNETVYKEINTLERGQKYLLSQIKKIFAELGELNYKSDPQFYEITAYLDLIRRSSKIEHIMQKTGPSKVQNLNISSKVEGSTVEQENKMSRNLVKTSNSNVTNKPASQSNSSSSLQMNLRSRNIQNQCVKLSLTKNGKVQKEHDIRLKRNIY